jgi:hypothetical protein
MLAGIAIAGAVAVAALVVLIVVLVRKRPLSKRLSGAFGIATPQQQKPDGPPGVPPEQVIGLSTSTCAYNDLLDAVLCIACQCVTH